MVVNQLCNSVKLTIFRLIELVYYTFLQALGLVLVLSPMVFDIVSNGVLVYCPMVFWYTGRWFGILAGGVLPYCAVVFWHTDQWLFGILSSRVVYI